MTHTHTATMHTAHLNAFFTPAQAPAHRSPPSAHAPHARTLVPRTQPFRTRTTCTHAYPQARVTHTHSTRVLSIIFFFFLLPLAGVYDMARKARVSETFYFDFNGTQTEKFYRDPAGKYNII